MNPRSACIVEELDPLLASGKTPGSPQLKSFGPDMVLATELLVKGERTAVLEFFGLCRMFWELDEGRLDAWEAALKEGKTPEFSKR